MITLGPSQLLAASASVGSSVTCTVFGDQLQTASDNFKAIYQGQLITSATQLFSNNSSQQALIKAIHLANTSASNVTVKFYTGGTAVSNQIVSMLIPAGGSATYESGQGWSVYDANGVVQVGQATVTYNLVLSQASASSLTPNVDQYSMYAFTALAAGLTINAPTGTLTDGRQLEFRIYDNGTTRALTWNAIFKAGVYALPAATVVGQILYVQVQYDSNRAVWDVINVTSGDVLAPKIIASGSAILVAGTKAVAFASILGTDQVQITVATPGGAQGFLSAPVTAGVGFTINSTSATETSTVFWSIIR
jgi:hypothetical protein